MKTDEIVKLIETRIQSQTRLMEGHYSWLCMTEDRKDLASHECCIESCKKVIHEMEELLKEITNLIRRNA